MLLRRAAVEDVFVTILIRGFCFKKILPFLANGVLARVVHILWLLFFTKNISSFLNLAIRRFNNKIWLTFIKRNINIAVGCRTSFWIKNIIKFKCWILEILRIINMLLGRKRHLWIVAHFIYPKIWNFPSNKSVWVFLIDQKESVISTGLNCIDCLPANMANKGKE